MTIHQAGCEESRRTGYRRKKGGTYRKVLFIGQHKLRCARIICAVRFIDDEFFFLLFHMDQRARTKNNDSEPRTMGRHMVRIRTHTFQEMLTPALVLPR